MNILVTGGAGYIGSHTCVALLKAGHCIVVADNLSNSREETLEKVRLITGKDFPFYLVDVAEEKQTDKIFRENKIEGLIHFAGYKSVAESVEKPLDYYYNNLLSTIALCRACIRHGIGKFVFSSSATVYGENAVPLKEEMELKPANPYGATKAMSERILSDTAVAHHGFAVSLLRYFNPVGAHPSGLIGESSRGIPNNLMPCITQVALGKIERLKIFGNDYPTPDGTGVRDYIHVADLALGHVAAIEKLESGVDVYNLGTGRGTSVMELVNTFQRVTGVMVPYEITGRRPGDIAECYADKRKAERELAWKAERSIEDMCRDAWRFELTSSI